MIIKSDALRELTSRIFAAMGVPEVDAQWIASLLVKSNLTGHDSHGVVRIPQYYQMWRDGGVDPKARPVVVQEGSATALMDGRLAFGQIVAREAMTLCIRKGQEVGIAGVGLHNFTHLGRLADFAEMAVEQKMLGFVFAGSRTPAQWVAPWGGCAGRLSTNPLAFASPAAEYPPLSLDFATSVVPEGVVRIKKIRGEQTPPGCLIDSDGQPTNDPNVLYTQPRGSILTVGGHKGYALSLMVDILGCLLGRAGERSPGAGPEVSRLGAFVMTIDVSRFADAGQFPLEVDALIRHVKSSPPAPGFTEVLSPGELEARREQQLLTAGIELEEQTWGQIQKVAEDLAVPIG